MALKLIAPGKIKRVKDGITYANPCYQIRGRLGGQRVDRSTDTIVESEAHRLLRAIEAGILAGNKVDEDSAISSRQGADVTFAVAGDRCALAKRWKKNELARLEQLKAQPELANIILRDVTEDHMHKIATRLYPNSPSSQVRSIYTPMSTIIRYGAKSSHRWCTLLVIERPKLPGKINRLPAADFHERLSAAADADIASAADDDGRYLAGKKRLWIEWLAKHGRRLSEPLHIPGQENSGVFCERINLDEGRYETFISKNQKWMPFEMDDDVVEMTRRDPDMQKFLTGKSNGGPLFPWTSRHQVLRWFNPLCERVGLRQVKTIKTKAGHYIKHVVSTQMTHHRARHALGTELGEQRVDRADIQGLLGHLSPSSTDRYVHATRKGMRKALNDRRERRNNVTALPKKERA